MIRVTHVLAIALSSVAIGLAPVIPPTVFGLVCAHLAVISWVIAHAGKR